MLTSNYHTHTYRCGHALGKDEEYVLEALSLGIRNLGFSDHIMLPGFSEPGVRGDYSLFDDYKNSITSLRKKYKDQMNIYLGFEAESFLYYMPYYSELVNNKVIDYLVLGNHSAMNENQEIFCSFRRITNPSQLYLYKDLAISAISSGLFSIFAHPDYFMYSIQNFDNDCKKISREIIETCIAYDVPLEINVAGIRNGKKKIGSSSRWIYPTNDFFSIVKKYPNAKCIIGLDAHHPNQISDTSANYEAVKFAKEFDLNIVDKLDKIKLN